ncbi:amidohydrolase [Clostridium tyrobutyricum]|uniref:amidohydrolase n=1 Tax=Clostridium tyrobutyricum TaxID=1519 RepID=UPI00057D2048|nr:amidohydrolase [Clostridium tyrobutyricum]
MKADLIVKGKVFTADKLLPLAEAFAVKNGKIVFVGKQSEISKYFGNNTKIIENKEGIIIPGMTDGHAHVTSTTDLVLGVNLHEVETAEEYLEKIKQFYQNNDDINIIFGQGYQNGVFDEIGPTAAMLDKVSNQIPIIMVSEDEHTFWINSKTMSMAGIDEKTPEIDGGIIVRYPCTRKPTGWLKELAGSLIQNIMPAYTKDDYKKGILAYQSMALSTGVTNVFEPMLDKRKDYDLRYEAYAELAREGKLKITFTEAYTLEPNDDYEEVFKKAKILKNKINYDKVRLTTLKIFIDGVVEAHTAFLREEYNDAPGDFGESLFDQDQLNKLVTRAIKEGYVVHTHAIGDAALDCILNAYEYAQNKTAIFDRRNAVTHLQVVEEEQIDRMKQLHIVAVINPYWHFKNPIYYRNLEVPFIGQERADKEYPAASFIKKGIVTSQASDWPVTVPADTMTSLHLMVNRVETGKKGVEALNPNERISVEEALMVLTVNGAYESNLESRKGTISVGKDADFVVLDKDVLSIDAFELYKTKICQTYINGKLVFNKGE